MARQAQHASKAIAEKRIAAEMTAAKHHEGKSAAEEARHHEIAEVAYRIAKQRGFQGDRALDDWLQAEAEVDARHAGKH